MRHHRFAVNCPAKPEVKLCCKESKAKYSYRVRNEKDPIRSGKDCGAELRLSGSKPMLRKASSGSCRSRVRASGVTDGKRSRGASHAKAHRHAQRKFASVFPAGPQSLQEQACDSSFSRRHLADDFISFLCFRNTPALPKHLEFFSVPPSLTDAFSSKDEDSQTCLGQRPSGKLEDNSDKRVLLPVRPCSVTPQRDKNSFEPRDKDRKLTVNKSSPNMRPPEEAHDNEGDQDIVEPKTCVESRRDPKRESRKRRLSHVSDISAAELHEVNVEDVIPLAELRKSSREKPRELAFDKPLPAVHESVDIKVCQAADSALLVNGLAAPLLTPLDSASKDFFRFFDLCQSDFAESGICRVLTPASWRAFSTNFDELSFPTKTQRIHLFLNRFPRTKLLSECFKSQLLNGSSADMDVPQIVSCELDLPLLMDKVSELGGALQLSTQNKWRAIADDMRIPSTAPNRVAALERAYTKHVLPFSSLSNAEQRRTMRAVERALSRAAADDIEFQSGQHETVASFRRCAAAAHLMYAHDVTETGELETKFWEIVHVGDRHVAPICGVVDTSCASFQASKTKSGWNLATLVTCAGSALKYLGPVSGVTVPWLKLESVFSTSGWRAVPGGLYCLNYLHTGADKIIYAIPRSSSPEVKQKILKVMSSHGKASTLDALKTILIPPARFETKGLAVYRVVQREGEFVILCPDTLYCTVSAGYSCSESVYFAPMHWLSSLCCRPVPSLDSPDMDTCIDAVVVTAASHMADGSLRLDRSEGLYDRLRAVAQQLDSDVELLRELGIAIVQQKTGRHPPGTTSRPQNQSLCSLSPCKTCGNLCFFIKIRFRHSADSYCLSDAVKMIEERVAEPKELKVFLADTIDFLSRLVHWFSVQGWEKRDCKSRNARRK